MRSLKLLIVPVALLSTLALADSTQSFLVKRMGSLLGVASGARVGRITFKAKEGATLARAFEDTSLDFSPGTNGNGEASVNMVNFVVNSLHGGFDPTPFTIGVPSKTGLPEPEVTVVSSLLTRVVLPELSLDAFDPAVITFDLNTLERRRREEEILNPVDKAALKEQKKWLPANFRLRVGDLPTSRVSKVEAITIKQQAADLDGDGVAEVSRSISPISFCIPLSESEPFRAWFEETLLGKGTTRPLSLVYMDGDKPLFSLDLSGVGIVGLDFNDQFTDPYRKDGVVLVKVIQIDQQKLDSILNLIR